MPKTLKTRSGRVIELPTAEQDAAINAGIALDKDSPEWTDSDFAQARPARDVLKTVGGAELAETMLRPRGRPRAAVVKVRISIRLSPEVLRYFQASGEGWQTRMNEALREWVAEHQVN